jgi:hypothetical protein
MVAGIFEKSKRLRNPFLFAIRNTPNILRSKESCSQRNPGRFTAAGIQHSRAANAG